MSGWDHRYRMLDEGEIIRASDECQHDDGSWPCDNGRCAGQPAPSPAYTSHRIYRRRKDAPAALAQTPTDPGCTVGAGIT